MSNIKAYAIKNTIDGSYLDKHLLPTFNRGDRKLYATNESAEEDLENYFDQIEDSFTPVEFGEIVETTLIVQTDETHIGTV